MAPTGPPPQSQNKRQTVFSAFSDTYNEAKERRAARQAKRARKKPPPWIVRKLAVGFVLALIGYVEYVYVGRLCVSMLSRDSDARGSFGQGIAYLVIFQLLWLMVVWSYLKIITVSPGFARDYIRKSPSPSDMQHTIRTGSSDTAVEHTIPEEFIKPSPPAPEKQRSPPSSYRTARSPNAPTEVPPNNPIARSFQGPSELDAVPPLAAARAAATSPHRPEPAVRPSWDAPARPPPLVNDPPLDELPPSRRPNEPVLLPEYRYCYRDEIIKPYRAHHCSVCGTDVLMFDHHCLWIGQCVGARNRKFFVNFLQWAVIFTFWMFVTLVIANTNMSSSQNLDGQEVAVIALSGFFMLFTFMLLASHTWLLSVNATTVEHFTMQRLAHKDERAVNDMHSWWNISAKRRTRKQWDHEWGGLTTEGHLWWLGSRRACWEATMGTTLLGWILPIGRSQSDGLSYPVNPRFAPDGRWRRRSEWPPELR